MGAAGQFLAGSAAVRRARQPHDRALPGPGRRDPGGRRVLGAHAADSQQRRRPHGRAVLADRRAAGCRYGTADLHWGDRGPAAQVQRARGPGAACAGRAAAAGDAKTARA